MLYTRQNAMENIRNKGGKRVFYLGKGDQLTSDARDWLSGQRIEILPAEQAKPDRWQLLGGGFCQEKPEHMTHLNGEVLVPKTHPRIAFRGAMDMLEAELLLCRQQTGETRLEEILALARELIRCDVLEEPVQDMPLCGLSQDELRLRSHLPQKYYGQPHFMPAPGDSQTVLLLNRVRCLARSAELQAVRAFSDRDGILTRVDILRALNRMSSMLYLLMIEHKAKK
jgi:ethanolamine utilization cobalamin adenosyltransferase